MKTTRLFLYSLAAGAVLPVTGLFAQSAAPAVAPLATPSVSAPASTATTADADEKGATHGQMAAYKSLTPEEQGKLRAAAKAARKDPAFVAAKAERTTNPKAFREARKAAMLKADPSVGPIMDKLQAERKEKRAERKGI